MRRTVTILLLLLVTCAVSQAQSVALPSSNQAGTWQEANAAYREHDFEKARRIYENLLTRVPEREQPHPDLLYDLGNTWFRIGETGRAAWMYERSLNIAPRHGDARKNLQLARAGHPEEDAGISILLRPFAWVAGRLGVGEWLVVMLAGLWVACLGGAVRLLARGKGLRFAGAFAVGAGVVWLCLTGAFALPRIADEALHDYGVVLTSDAVVRAGPGMQEQAYFEALAGERMLIEAAPLRGWLRVKRPRDGRVGFLPEDAVGRIDA